MSNPPALCWTIVAKAAGNSLSSVTFTNRTRQDVPLAFHLSDYSMFSAISFVLCFQRPNQLPFAERTAQFFGNFNDRVLSLMSS